MTTATQEVALTPQQGTALATRPIDTVRLTLEKLKPQMTLALPRHLTADRLCRVAMTAIQNTPKLLECDRTSLFAAVMSCAQLGLEPDGVLGQAYLVPFGSGERAKVQLIVGYKGLISLARNSGDVVSIAAHEVCEKDFFRYVFGLEEKLEHIPANGDRGQVTHFYAVAQFKGGGHHFDVMTRAEVEAIRDGSSGYKTAVRFAKAGQDPQSPWVQSFVEMGKKSAIRRIAKYLPMNVQKAAAMAEMYETGRHSELGESGELRVDPPANGGDVIDVQPEPEVSGLDAFAAPAESLGSSSPDLISTARAAELRALASAKGIDADEIAAELSGSGLESTPAGFDQTIANAIENHGKAKGGKRG